MKPSKEVISNLVEQYSLELESAVVYTSLAGLFGSWGLKGLKDDYKADAREELHHADKVLKRILFLVPSQEVYTKGVDNKDCPKNVPEAYEKLQTLMEKVQGNLADGILIAETADDYVTRKLLVHLLCPTEDTLQWLAEQKKQIEILGLQNYLTTLV